MTFTAHQILPTSVKPPITREQLNQYAQASGDFNPIHLDQNFAREAGFPGVIAHGMLSMAFLGDYINEHFPPSQYRLVRFKVRFKKITFPGDEISCQGTIRSVEPKTITVILAACNQNAEETTSGEATLETL